jgi:hypothetical protein
MSDDIEHCAWLSDLCQELLSAAKVRNSCADSGDEQGRAPEERAEQSLIT